MTSIWPPYPRIRRSSSLFSTTLSDSCMLCRHGIAALLSVICETALIRHTEPAGGRFRTNHSPGFVFNPLCHPDCIVEEVFRVKINTFLECMHIVNFHRVYAVEQRY